MTPHDPIDIYSLSGLDVQIWFTLRGRSPQTEEAIQKLRNLLSRGPLNPALRLVAKNQERILAGLSARYAEGLISFSEPIYCKDIPAEKRKAATDSLLDEFINIARSRTQSKRTILETRPADDVPYVHTWINCLQSRGFVEIACAHLFVYDLRSTHLSQLDAQRVSLIPYDHNLSSLLSNLYKRTRAITFDRWTKVTMQDATAYIAELESIGDAGLTKRLWWIGAQEGMPFGFVLGAIRTDPMFEGRTGLVLEVGIVPERRGNGLGRLLLSHQLQVLAEEGAHRAVSLIDDVNVPSLRMHDALEFMRLPDRFMVYQRVLV